MKRIALSLLLLAKLATPAFARIGETEAEIEARYGKQSSSSGFANYLRRTYFFNGYAISVHFLNKICEREDYIPQQKEPFKPEQLKALLAGNADGNEWLRLSATHFEFRKLGYTAIFYKDKNMLAVSSKKYCDWIASTVPQRFR